MAPWVKAVAGTARSVYRDAAGKPVPASWGDRRLCWQRWQSGETGLYARQHASYIWRRSSIAGWCPEETCPICGKPAFLNATLDRFFHEDGTGNRECWVAKAQGRVVATAS